jgi:hypothetical protein
MEIKDSPLSHLLMRLIVFELRQERLARALF